jgi:hypothetical protein
MPRQQPKWIEKKINPTTRSRSKKQEKKIAKDFGGYATFNSGATLGQNDVLTSSFEFECKTTTKSSYTVKLAEMKVLEKKAHVNKIPVFVIQFEDAQKSYALIDLETFKNMAEKEGLI